MSDTTESFAIVNTRLKGLARVCNLISSEPVFRGLETGSSISEIDSEEAGVSEWVKNKLNQIENKLDTLLSDKYKHDLLEDFPIAIEIKKISGGRIIFGSTFPFDDNPYEVVIFLEKFPLCIAGAKGFVVNLPSDNLYELIFENIRDNDLELIIKYVFKQQREEIRVNRSK